jgi:hypothetical protein
MFRVVVHCETLRCGCECGQVRVWVRALVGDKRMMVVVEIRFGYENELNHLANKSHKKQQVVSP